MTDIDNTMSGAQVTTAINARLEDMGSEVSISNESESSVCEKLNGVFDDFDGTTELTSSMSGSGFAGAVNGNFEIAEQEQPTPEVAPDPIKFLHYSDPHGNTKTTEKAVSMMTDSDDPDYDADIEFAVLSGDNADAYYSAMANALVDADTDTDGRHLVIMGNHDIGYTSADTSGYLRNHAAMVTALRSYMVEAGVHYGEVSGKEDIAYWHKDYPLSNGKKLRVIATDEYDINPSDAGFGYASVFTQAQVDWFIGLLDELNEGDYFLVVTHKYPSLYNMSISQYRRSNDWCSAKLNSWDGNDLNMGMFADIVNAYLTGDKINNNYSNYNSSVRANKNWTGKTSQATFLCFLCGHLHGDFHKIHPTHNGDNKHSSQLVLCVSTAGATGDQSDILDQTVTAAEKVLMNKVTVDFEHQQIIVDRIGAQAASAVTVGGVDYPAVTRDTITFGFDAQVVED